MREPSRCVCSQLLAWDGSAPDLAAVKRPSSVRVLSKSVCSMHSRDSREAAGFLQACKSLLERHATPFGSNRGLESLWSKLIFDEHAVVTKREHSRGGSHESR